MHHRHQGLLALALLLAVGAQLAGCASGGIETSTTFDPLHPFPTEATFVWDERSNRLPNDPRIQQLELAPIITEAANAEFSARGYRPVEGAANYRLSFDLAVHSWIGADNSRSIGSLSLILIEAASNHRVWLGYARADVHVGLSVEERRERMRRAIARMLGRFPPSQR
jgi:hypothetical protein